MAVRAVSGECGYCLYTHVGRVGYIVFHDRFLLRIDDCAVLVGTDDEIP